ncbi:hypothetical protein OEZ85_014399 [Tetradesmus obliquus]|uniref:RING-type E3 ubiquitin transferase n=1 Tax=Tetradesmus obliquus TaxID=3088 RepID=A0ABY8U7Z3_TETOB|nr:hypothetical protein OEZ85_014399 [Tetradesmus obliquus]
MTSNVLCKYYQQGACAFGDQCRFSHNKVDEASQVCKYYLQGNCAYGDRCRYEHSKPSWSGRGQPAAPSNYQAPRSVPKPPVGGPAQAADLGRAPSGGKPNWDDYMTPDEMDEFEQWQAEQDQIDGAEAAAAAQQGGDVEGEIMDPADIPLCNEYAATGACSAGEDCLYVHGEVCEICGYYCVHPYNPDWTAQHQEACKQAMEEAGQQGEEQQQQEDGAAAEDAQGEAAAAEDDAAAADAEAEPAAAAADAAAEGEDGAAAEPAAADADAAAAADEGEEEGKGASCQQHALHPFNAAAAQQHAASCAALAASIAKRKRDGAIECGICYEKVLGKADVSSRRFGLMACEHSFCLGCIRSWRSTAEVDKVTALRTCPICRTPTHFITPSSKWPDTAADKEAIVSAYKAAMGQRDCSHFDFGEGSCPFGTSCFYRHAHRDGRLEEVQLRRAANDEGQAAYAEYLRRDDSGAIAAFLDDATTNLLQVSVAKSANGQLQVRLTNAADFPQACFYQLSLCKVKPGVLVLADIPGGIALSTIANSPLSSLYHSLSNVYCPVLGIEQAGSTCYSKKQQQQQTAVDPRLQELILHVQAGLGKALRGADAAQAGDQAAAAVSLAEILNPLDELQYWADMAGNPAMGVHAHAAAQVLRQLEPLQQQLAGLAAGSLEGEWEGALELVGHLGDALRQVWPLKMPPAGWAFPQRRMVNLLKVLGAAFAAFVQRKLQGVDLWHTSFNVLKGSLISAGQLLSAWAAEARTLSSDWAAGVDAGGHAWEGPAAADSYTAAFQERLEQIYALRELHEELTALLSQEEASALGLAAAFAPFGQLAALHVSEFTGAAWATAAAEHERRLEAVEARISQKLRELFATVIIPNMALSNSQQAGQRGGASAAAAAAAAAAGAGSVAHPQQLFQELRQYSRLLSRRGLAAALEAELLALAKQEDVLSQLADAASWKSSRLMAVDAASSHVRCQFSEGLVGLLREVRQLQALGFSMRRELLAEVETAGKFYRYGMVLQQCAHFYNNIATEMIPCQKPLMLADAVEFEKVLMNPKDATGRDITWHNASALEGYVRRLSAVAERLAASNRQLRQWHSVLAGKVVMLMSTDLVRHKDTWVSIVKDMRSIFANLEAQGYPRERQEVWRAHWDFQLFKALEVQFRAGLESIHKSLPEVEVSLVYKNKRLQFDPPLEALRLQHYSRHLNGFLGLPLRMRGVSNLSERQGFFAPIADADPTAIARVYESCEALFAALADEAKKYSDWLVLGDVAGELEEHVEAVLCGDSSSSGSGSSSAAGGDVGDWELNLRMLKTAAHDLNKLPNEVRLDCYRVSLSPFKAYVEEMIKRLREALGASLRKKALAERQAIEDFLSAGAALLALQASSVEEIGRAGQEARGLVARLGEVPQLRKRVEEKNRLLRQMAAATPAGAAASSALTAVDLAGLSERWDGFVGQLQAYDSHLEGQRAGLQQQLGKKLEDFGGTVAGFASRWQSIKPRGGPSGNPAVVMAQLEDAARQLQDVLEEAEQLCKECEALGVALPAFPQLEEVAADLAATQASWGGYRDFLAERDALAHKDWLSMRDQVWKIEDFLTKWDSSCSGASAADPGKAAIALVLLQEIDTYRRCLPHLKSCMRGIGWEDSHWLQLFSLLGFKQGSLAKDTVTLAHFLDKADAIIANVEKIKALDAMAQGEALIRKALSELKLWGLQRNFTFVPSKDSSSSSNTAPAAAGQAGGSRAVQLIKEWSEVLSELGNHQSLVASLKMSAYHHLFKDEVASWESRLATLVEGLGLLQGIQRRWLYLEPIFVRGALPAVAGRFRHVDGEFRAIMGQLAAAGKVVGFAELPGVLA